MADFKILTPPEANMLLYGAVTNLKCDTALLTEKSKHRIPVVDKSGHLYKDGEQYMPKIGDILAIKSTSIPFEMCRDNPYTNFDKIQKDKANSKSRYSRKKTEGNGLYIYGSVEYVIYTGELIKKSTLKKKEKIQLLPHKNVRLYPATGRLQIPGIKPTTDIPSDLVKMVLAMVEEDLESKEPLKMLEEKTNMVNSKLATIDKDENKFIDLYSLSVIFEKIREENAFVFPIIFVTEKHMVCSHMFIRVSTPIDTNPKRKTTIKVFSSKKINIFGSPSFEVTDSICKGLDSVFFDNFDDLIKSKDLSNTVIVETDITKLF
jgi:hypothetical protein